jgi:hypothetical protein
MLYYFFSFLVVLGFEPRVVILEISFLGGISCIRCSGGVIGTLCGRCVGAGVAHFIPKIESPS